MKQHWNWLVGVAVVLTLCGPVLAKGKGGGRAAGKAEYKPVVWLVDSVSSNSCTLTKSDHSEMTNLTVSAATQIVVKGQPGKLSDIQVGMRTEFVATGANVTLLNVEEYIAPVEKAAKGGKGGGKGARKRK